MVNLNIILNKVIVDAKSVGFPVSENLDNKIYIDKKRYDRVGACYRYKFPEKYEIHLSEDVQKASVNNIESVIAHEVLHSNFLTMEHNYFWEMYRQRMNNKFGYNIQVKYSWLQILK